jgi:aryl-alcohol dehydrogenase-like predicted oxidoreductase
MRYYQAYLRERSGLTGAGDGRARDTGENATMTLKPLGRTGVQVSARCFSTMSFGGDGDEPAAAAMYRACRDTSRRQVSRAVEASLARLGTDRLGEQRPKTA